MEVLRTLSITAEVESGSETRVKETHSYTVCVVAARHSNALTHPADTDHGFLDTTVTDDIMGDVTGISWCDKTSSPWHGCSNVSPGCDHCWAQAGALRNPKTLGVWGQDGTRVPSKSNADKLRRWNEEAKKLGRPLKVFPSICDPFEDFPGLNELRAPWFRLLEATPHLTHLLLTKRPQNVLKMAPRHWVHCDWSERYQTDPRPVGDICTMASVDRITCPHDSCDMEDGQRGGWPKNVWIGTTAENVDMAWERIPALCRIPAVTRFLSIEPQLEYVEIAGGTLPRVHWVIQGCESGPKPRPFDLEWARRMRATCEASNIAYFLKQIPNAVDPRHPITDVNLFPEDLRIQQVPE